MEQNAFNLMLMLFLLSFMLTGLVRYYALHQSVLDIPNARSSHSLPTPRGGGVAFVVIFLLYLIYLGHMGRFSFWDEMAFLVAGVGVAGLGFVDDHHPISSKWRLLGHFVACGIALFCLGGLHPLMSLGWPLQMLVLLYMVWLLNLYNFMDGIDGLAAVEAVFVCLSAVWIESLQGSVTIMMLPLVLAAVVAGFLCWNFPVARLFMGDVGSGFLGVMMGILSIQAANSHANLLWSWLILLGVFIVDATLTLFRRLFNGERIVEAHRSHAYQRAVDKYQRHASVTLRILVLNLVWLLPLAIAVGCGYLNGMLGLMIAYLPLIWIGLQFQRSATGEF